MITTSEQLLSRSLRKSLADLPNGAAIPDSEDFRSALTALEYFIPVVLGEIHREWKFEGLDQVVPVSARKTGADEAEIFGLCCFVGDQTLTPLHIHFQIAPSDDEISWFECKLGEQEQDGMVRKPYQNLREMEHRLLRLDGKIDSIEWVYRVTFGKRR